MMRRTTVLIVFFALVALALMALSASAQTNPPSTGDWVISDSTTVSNSQVTIQGSVRVIGSGHLSMTTVNLRFSTLGTHEISVTSNARLTINGGSITSTGGLFSTALGGTIRIDDCAISNTQGLSASTWNFKVRNCTVSNPSGTGIAATPVETYSNEFDVSDNFIDNPGASGIDITVGNLGTTEVRIICANNNVTSSLSDAISCSANTEKGRFYFQGNEVFQSAGHGLNFALDVYVVGMYINNVRVQNATLDGVHATVESSINLMRTVEGVTSVGNGGQGVFISFTQFKWISPVFRGWFIFDNVGGGVSFRNFDCATISDSYNVNNQSSSDYTVSTTVLFCYRTEHRKAQARINSPASAVYSWRYMNFHTKWQNGNPVYSKTVEFEDGTGTRLFYWTTDSNGWLGNNTSWDWRVTETRSFTRTQITPYLVGGSLRLPGTTFEFNRDFKGDLVFNDNQPPDLTVTTPGSNHVQNTDNLTIEGTCNDAHSGANLVQVSFDPEPTWSKKNWNNATGIGQWEIYFDPWYDGTFTVYVRAFDNANFPGGIFANVTISNVTIDTSAPNLTIIQPILEHTIINTTQMTVLGTTDPDVVTLTINGEAIPFYGATFNKAILLYEGDNTLVIVATDFAGNIAKVMKRVTLDSIPPILVVTYPPDPHITNKQSLVIGGFTDIEGIDIEVDGVPVQVTKGTWSHTVTLVKGKNSILIDAEDIAENHRIKTVVVTYDPDPPRINIDKPEEGALINGSTIWLLGVTDPDIRHNQIMVNGIFIGIHNGVFDYQMTVVEEGLLNITIVAVDRAGNENTETVQVFVDSTPPEITSLSLEDGEIVNSFPLTITGETEDGASLYIEGDSVPVVNGYFSKDIPLVEGKNTVEFLVIDEAGNRRNFNRIVSLDTLPPTLFFPDIVGNITTTDKRFYTITGSTEANARLMVSYNNINNEQIFIATDGVFSHPIIVGDNETTEVVMRVVDYAGNSQEYPLTIKRVTEEEPSYLKEHPEVAYGIAFLAIALAIAFVGARYALSMTYEQRLKRMGYGSTPGAPGEQAPAPGPAPDRRQAPRPPKPDEGGALPQAPRPPKPDE